jgi:hypothetical protein
VNDEVSILQITWVLVANAEEWVLALFNDELRAKELITRVALELAIRVF